MQHVNKQGSQQNNLNPLPDYDSKDRIQKHCFAMEKDMNFRMIHSCIRVMNLEASEKFYTRAFELEISRKRDFPENRFTLSYLKATDGDFELELTYNYDRDRPYETGDGYSHLALGVQDLEASHQRHQEMGLSPTDLKGLVQGKPQFYFVSDPDGYLIEIVRSQN